MSQKWSLIKDGKIVETITNGDGKFSLVGGRKSGSHSDDWLLNHGYLPHIAPAVKRFQQIGEQEILADRVTNKVVPRPRSEVLANIKSNTEQAYDSKKENITVSRKVIRGLVRAEYLTYKHIQYKDFGVGSPLTAAEKQTMAYLNSLGVRAFDLESAEANIIIEAEEKTDEELQALPDDWESTHPGWTE